MKRRWKFVIAISIIILTIGCPLFLDAAIFGNNVQSNIDNSTWAGFFGSYLGAIIGGLVSLLGIGITIVYTQDQNRKDRELQIRPYFDFMYNHTEKPTAYKKDIGYVAFECDPDVKNSENKEPEVNGVLVLKNIGVGTALHCSMDYTIPDNGRKYGPVLFTNPKTIVGVNAFQPGEEGSITFHMKLNFETIPKETFIEVDNRKIPPFDATKKYPDFEIKMHFSYCDLLENRYSQELIFKSNIYTSYKMDGSENGKYLCDMHLINVTQPVKEEEKYNEYISNRGKGYGRNRSGK